MFSSKKIDPLQKTNAKDNFSYSRQAIIDFAYATRQFSQPALLLKEKWNAKKNPCYLISGADFLRGNMDIHPYSKDDHSLRIYIIGHCKTSADYLTDGEGRKVYFNELANCLSHFIGDQNATVNLVMCFAAKGLQDNSTDSFAAKLHSLLAQKTGRNIPIVARNYIVSVISSPIHKATVNSTVSIEEHEQFLTDRNNAPEYSRQRKFYNNQYNRLFVHHQDSSKFIFLLDKNNHQVKIDAYYHFWRNRILKVINQIINTTRVKEKQNLLQAWLDIFPTKTDEEIWQMIQVELSNRHSILKEHNNLFSYLFGRKNNSYKKMNELITERMRPNSGEPYNRLKNS